MHPTTTIPRPRGRNVGGALLIMLATTAASIWLVPRPVTASGALVSSAVTAAGTLALAFYLARRAAYPRWGLLGAAGVLAVAAMAGPLLVRDPAAWAQDVRPMLWMHPWFIMAMGLTPSKTRPSACAPGAPWAGWLLVGTAALFSLIALGAAALALRS